jgi:ribonuclease HI
LETIHPFIISPWKERLAQHDKEKASEIANAGWAVRVATSSSARNGIVGIGGALLLPKSENRGGWINTCSITLGTRSEQNPYTAELAAIEKALKLLPESLKHRVIIVITNNKAAASAVSQPRQQSGQEAIHRIYNAVADLRNRGNMISISWILDKKAELARAAKEAARQSTEKDSIPKRRPSRALSATLSTAKREQSLKRLPARVGLFSKKVDATLPGKHTRTLYDSLSWREARVLAQLRTGMARLNRYLHLISVAPSDQYPCGNARETVEHFLFRCVKWTELRTRMLQYTDTRRGNLSFYLGGKATSDPENWTPDMNAVRATIGYAIATHRLNEE